MDLKVKEIHEIIGSSWFQKIDTSLQIKWVNIDSRQNAIGKNHIFFSLKGSQSDGHHYIRNAYNKGIRTFVISTTSLIPKLNMIREANILIVGDTLIALQLLARHHREKSNALIIGITGSNGKTIVKEWLFHLLSPFMKAYRSPKSYNSQIGVALSILGIEAFHELAIIEAGISRKGEMRKLESMIQPDIGIFTNIGTQHADGFKNVEEKIDEKLKLFSKCDSIIYGSNNNKLETQIKESYFDKALVSWGTKRTDDIKHIRYSQGLIEFRLGEQPESYTIQLPYLGIPAYENFLSALGVVLALKIPIKAVLPLSSNLPVIDMRLEITQGRKGNILINDSYSNDLYSLELALNQLTSLQFKDKRLVILSDILHSNMRIETLYGKVAKLIVKNQVKHLVGIGNEIKILKSVLSNSVYFQHFSNVIDFLKSPTFNELFDTTILIKGARKFRFERISDILEFKKHQSRLEVNLGALQHNLSVFRSMLKPDTKILAMVKAQGYGSGAREVANLMQYQNVDYLGVAYIDEGISLRQNGIKTPILVLNVPYDQWDIIKRYDLEPEIYSIEQMVNLLDYLKKENTKLSIHLKLETGMNRLGIDEKKIPALKKYLNNYKKYVNIASVFSHLAASGNLDQREFTLLQINKFQHMYEGLVLKGEHRPLRHILNTSGIINFPEAQFEMVRLGLGMFGVGIPDIIKPNFEVTNKLLASISQIKELKKGETISYNRNYTVENESMKMATITIGYADGLPRSLSNKNYKVKVNGKFVSIVGDICMDMAMIDVSSINNVKVGDQVTIFGTDPSIEDLANEANTIPYEILTNISDRIKRLYFYP